MACLPAQNPRQSGSAWTAGKRRDRAHGPAGVRHSPDRLRVDCMTEIPCRLVISRPLPAPRRPFRVQPLRLLIASALLGLSACSNMPAGYGFPSGDSSAPPPPSTPAPAPAAPVAPPPPPAPPTPAQQQQAQRVAQGVVDLLEAGNEEQARVELERALVLDPNNRLALNLSRQMTVDPIATLGPESFPYVVRGGDTLSRFAGRFLGDIYAFHILARYNNIKAPRQVGEGQTLRI